jgi:gastric triacylglycerol lipase
MFSLLGLHEFLPSQEVVAALEGALCAAQPALCVSFLAALCG